MKRLAFLFVVLILLLEMTGCGILSLQNNSQEQTSSTTDKPPQSSSSAVPSLEDAVNSDSTVPSRASVSSISSAPTSDTSPQTQQEILEQIHTALNTTVPLMLPTSVPAEKGDYLTATTAYQAWDYQVNLYETTQPAEINSQAASKGTLIATVEGTEYKDTSSAQDHIPDYINVDISGTDQTLDLGHNIKAMAEAGLGHQQLVWNEGRWCIWVDSPSDSAYKNKEYPDRNQLAKDVVAYLEDHMLPAPQEIGAIYIDDWDGNQVNNTTTVQWQHNLAVYQISSQDPMTALELAVAMKFN